MNTRTRYIAKADQKIYTEEKVASIAEAKKEVLFIHFCFVGVAEFFGVLL